MRSQPSRWSVLPTVAGFDRFNGWAKALMGVSALSLLCWSVPVRAELPCLDSSEECLTTLTALAISNSSEIEAINQRLELTGDRIEYAEAHQWLEFLPSSFSSVLSANPLTWIDPLRLIQNLLGGGDVQRNRLAIADLEIGAADLVRRREEVAESLAREVVDGVLEYEALGRRLELLESQLETQLQRQAVMEVAYRTGQGSTGTMLSVWQRTEELQAQIEEVGIEREQGVRALEVLCWVEESENVEEPEFIDSR